MLNKINNADVNGFEIFRRLLYFAVCSDVGMLPFAHVTQFVVAQMTVDHLIQCFTPPFTWVALRSLPVCPSVCLCPRSTGSCTLH